MAKSTPSLITLTGTFGGITFVKSAAYGNHIRSKRGTHKKATLNPPMQESGKRLTKANIPAKILNDAFKPYRRGGLEHGTLWNRLRSMFRKQLRSSGVIDFSALKPFEIHVEHPFDRFTPVQAKITPDREQSVLTVNLSYSKHPIFEKSSFIDGYQLTAIGIFPDLPEKTATTVAVHSPVMALEDETSALNMQLPIPPNAEAFLLCLKIEGCMKGQVNESPSTKGMRMVKAGKI